MVKGMRRDAELRLKYKKLHWKVAAPARKALGASPFRSDIDKPLLIHATHHRCGTVWFLHLLREVSARYGLILQVTEQEHLRPSTDFFFHDHADINFSLVNTQYRGSHLIRDPRDVVISGYFYHLWSTENWLHEKAGAYNGLSYQQHLKSLSKEDGITAELKRFSGHDLPHYVDWNYNNPNILELRYENIIDNQAATFEKLFTHYGFSNEAIETSTAIADSHSFRNLSGRSIGQEKKGTHLRSGTSGQWRQHFTSYHHDLCDDLLGNALDKLGY